MIVTCPTGHRLQIKDHQAGKKVRCPECKKIFIAKPDDELEWEGPTHVTAAQEGRPAAPSDDDEGRQDEEASFDEDNDEDMEPSRAKRKRGAPKRSLPLWRKGIGPVVLIALLGVLAVVVWRTAFLPGTVTLETVLAGSEVFVNGKQHKYDATDRVHDVVITLAPRDYEIKVTKPGFQPFVQQVSVQSGEEEKIVVDLIPVPVAKR